MSDSDADDIITSFSDPSLDGPEDEPMLFQTGCFDCAQLTSGRCWKHSREVVGEWRGFPVVADPAVPPGVLRVIDEKGNVVGVLRLGERP